VSAEHQVAREDRVALGVDQATGVHGLIQHVREVPAVDHAESSGHSAEVCRGPTPVPQLEGFSMQLADPINERRDSRGQLAHPLFRARLGLGQLIDVLGQLIEALLGARLGLGEHAHTRRQLDHVVGKHVPPQLGPPLGPLLQKPKQILEILNGERHASSSQAEYGRRASVSERVWDNWRKRTDCAGCRR